MTKQKKPTKTPPPATNKTEQPALQPANPDFVQALKPGEDQAVPKKDGRGGLRPGAGRPPGMTDEMAKVNRLPDKPNELICDVLELPFEFWAEANKMPELELTKEEAQRLGLPVTQLLEYFFPGKIPLIAWAFLNLAVTSKKIVFKRLKLVAAKRKGAGKAPKGGGAGPEPPAYQPPSAGPKSDMVQPAAGFMQVTK